MNSSEGNIFWDFQYYPNNQKEALYNWFSGTSSACPNVAGVLALFLQKNRTATTQEAKSWLLGTSSTYTTSGSYVDTDFSSQTFGSFWGNFSTYTTNTAGAINEQTYNVGNVSIVLDANHHNAYTQTAEMVMDSNAKILYNPYASTSIYDQSDVPVKFASGNGLKFRGVKIKFT